MNIKTVRFSGEKNELLKIALSIRNEVFVKEQGVPPSIEYDNYDITSNHFLIMIEGYFAATSRWRKTENGIKLERFAVLKKFRGEKLGLTLLNEVLFDVSVFEEEIYLHAQYNVIDFYKKFGFIEFGEEFFEAGIEHIKMVYLGKPL